MTEPVLQLPLILLTDFPGVLNWVQKQARCYEYDRGDGMYVLAAVTDELIPTRYETMEMPAATLNGPRGNMIRGMAYRDLLRKVDGIGTLNQ